jgi:protein-tyrosine phosphatase
MTLRILTICTGNICRSPFAAKLLASKLDRTAFKTASAGTSAMAEEPMQKTMQQIARSMGVKGTEKHRARALTPQVVAQADLLLGMEREHRSEAARLHPRAARISFTLLEFAHIVTYINDGQLQTLLLQNTDSQTAAIDAAVRMRGVVPRLNPDRLYDLQDPFGRSRQVYVRSGVQIEQAVDRIVNFFERAAKLSAALHNGHPSIVTTHDRK